MIPLRVKILLIVTSTMTRPKKEIIKSRQLPPPPLHPQLQQQILARPPQTKHHVIHNHMINHHNYQHKLYQTTLMHRCMPNLLTKMILNILSIINSNITTTITTSTSPQFHQTQPLELLQSLLHYPLEETEEKKSDSFNKFLKINLDFSHVNENSTKETQILS